MRPPERSDFQSANGSVVYRIGAAKCNSNPYLIRLQDNRRRFRESIKFHEKIPHSVYHFEKSASGRGGEFRHSVEKLLEFHFSRQIFFIFRCSANPDDPHLEVNNFLSRNNELTIFLIGQITRIFHYVLKMKVLF